LISDPGVTGKLLFEIISCRSANRSMIRICRRQSRGCCQLLQKTVPGIAGITKEIKRSFLTLKAHITGILSPMLGLRE